MYSAELDRQNSNVLLKTRILNVTEPQPWGLLSTMHITYSSYNRPYKTSLNLQVTKVIAGPRAACEWGTMLHRFWFILGVVNSACVYFIDRGYIFPAKCILVKKRYAQQWQMACVCNFTELVWNFLLPNNAQILLEWVLMHFEVQKFTGVGWEQSGLITCKTDFTCTGVNCLWSNDISKYKNIRGCSCDKILPEATSRT